MDPLTRRGVRVIVAAGALCAGAVFAAACGLTGDGDDGSGGSDAPPAASPPAAVAPEEALRVYVGQRLSQGFVPDCEEARRPDDVGKQCSRLRGERDGLLAYELGPIFGEFTRLLILQRAADSWTIVHLENRDPNLPPVPGIPWPLQVGTTVVIAGTGDCLRIRERPGLQGPAVTCLDDGTALTINSGPIQIDDLEWWQLEGYGWAAGSWLRYPEEAAVGPTATPEA